MDRIINKSPTTKTNSLESNHKKYTDLTRRDTNAIFWVSTFRITIGITINHGNKMFAVCNEP